MLKNDSFDLDLVFSIGVDEDLPFNLNLIDLGDGADNLISADASGTLSVTASASLTIGLSVDISDPFSPDFFIKDNTNFTLSAAVAGTDLDFDATVLVLELLVRDGSAQLDGAWTVELEDDPADGRYELFNEFGTGLISTSLTGSANANLPIFFLNENEPLDSDIPALLLTIDNLVDFFRDPGDNIELVLPDFVGGYRG